MDILSPRSWQVHRREVDLALNEITITRERLAAVDMTNYYAIDTMVIVSQAPRVRVPLSSVTRPFSSEVRQLICL